MTSRSDFPIFPYFIQVLDFFSLCTLVEVSLLFLTKVAMRFLKLVFCRLTVNDCLSIFDDQRTTYLCPCYLPLFGWF